MIIMLNLYPICVYGGIEYLVDFKNDIYEKLEGDLAARPQLSNNVPHQVKEILKHCDPAAIDGHFWGWGV